MTCPICGDRGVVKIGYRQEPDGYLDIGVCSCGWGQRYRTENAMACLAAKFGLERDQVNVIEALLDPEDFPGYVPPVVPVVDVTEAGRMRRAKL